MTDSSIIPAIAAQLDLALPEQSLPTHEWLATAINELINKDFGRLISVLYRLDVNELKMRQALDQHRGTDAGWLIAGLMIEREIEKKNSRKSTRRDDTIPDDEKW